MVDTSMIDVRAFYEQYVAVVGRPSTSRSDGREYHGSCPWCGGRDRFAFWDSGRYSCSLRASGCGRTGRDVIDFLRDYAGLDFVAACETLQIDPGSAYQRSVRHSSARDEAPSKQWQERAAAVIHQAQKILWSPRGQTARDYLRGRGLTETTIRNARLGYLPLDTQGSWYSDARGQWGLAAEHDADAWVWLPEGILIPWYGDGQLWKLSVRRLSGLQEHDGRYVQIKGSGEGLYRVDEILVDGPLVLCESEFDALAGSQACGDLAVFVATGAVTRARRDRWLARLGLASCVLVAYDDDVPDQNGRRAGDVGAAYWAKTLPHALRWLPWAHDVSEMVQQGQDLRQWVACGLEVAETALGHARPAGGDVQDEAFLRACSSEQTCSLGDRLSRAWVGDDHTQRAAVPDEHRREALPLDQTLSPFSHPPCAATPGALSSQPKAHCPFEIVVVGKDQHIRATKCPGRPLANGWCEAHQEAHTLLELGARFCYLQVQVHGSRGIGAGKASWEAYARRAPARWLEHDLPHLQALVKQRTSMAERERK